MEDESLSIGYDALQKVAGGSKLGNFHYVPVLFADPHHRHRRQRRILETQALLLAGVQGRLPAHGLLRGAGSGRAATVRLGADLREAQRMLEELRRMQTDVSEPALVLNEHCAVCEFRRECREEAIRTDNLSLLRGMHPKEIARYNRKGILTVTQLAHTFRPRRKGKRAPPSHRHNHALQAVAIRDHRIYVLGTPQLPNRPVRIYLDVESNPEAGYVYLIGLIVVADGEERHYSFWAAAKDQESQIFAQFLAVVAPYEELTVYCYGSHEKAFLERMRRIARHKGPVNRILNVLVNVLSSVYQHVYFPTYCNGLKDVGAYLGCSWSESEASGIRSIAWRTRWEETGDDRWKQTLLTYNLEDCAALRRVVELLHAVAAGPELKQGTVNCGNIELPATNVGNLDKLLSDRKWGRTQYNNSDFQFINNCAYFDYQRERVFVRTNRMLRAARARRIKARRRKPRANRKLFITASGCPVCKSERIKEVVLLEDGRCPRPRVRRAYDLLFTAGGIRRQVLECRSRMYQCEQCGHAFVPERYRRLSKHFHNLRSWAMYQHVAHRLSLRTIESMFEEFFELRVFVTDIHMFKSLMADYYRPAYKTLLRQILSGNVVHADETEVKLRVGKGYVWIFASMDTVLFMYRPNREGDFLHELLKDFKGVLVSDFYAAYDSLPCPQQKCLIHLIRDMNQDLLNHPFDPELKAVTGPFGTLLRQVIATVDEQGLKREQLQKHRRDVADYFQRLEAQVFRSEAAESLRTRMLKYRDKLFTFIKHDGVAWNNNNAENGIKQFAYYREDTVGTMSEQGIKDYLVLLSLCHSCRYRNVSFLRFLLSGQRDLDAFCARPGRARRRRSMIELYPKGFVSPFPAPRQRKDSQADSGSNGGCPG
ncbi:MAG: IS66 family transposase [Planctomycetota bacterium]|nr:IS66 family transposase [Planctomycetota bacterium]